MADNDVVVAVLTWWWWHVDLIMWQWLGGRGRSTAGVKGTKVNLAWAQRIMCKCVCVCVLSLIHI